MQTKIQRIKPILIYCAGKNKRLDTIAENAGLKLGIQLPHSTIYFPPFFVDQNWRKPDRKKYIQAVQSLRPIMATVIDIEHLQQIEEALEWGEEISDYVQYIVIIPKVSGIISSIPMYINNAEVLLGYSVPSKYSGSSVPLWEFRDRRVHLLGGSPKKQMELWSYLNIFSCDGNAIERIATTYCRFWDGRAWQDMGSGKDFIYEAFKRSCDNLILMWESI